MKKSQASLKMDKLMEKVLINIKLEKYIQANSKTVISMELDNILAHQLKYPK